MSVLEEVLSESLGGFRIPFESLGEESFNGVPSCPTRTDADFLNPAADLSVQSFWNRCGPCFYPAYFSVWHSEAWLS